MSVSNIGPWPQIIAHRGASGEAPENTLAAFALAWRQQADGIELDLRLCADGQLLVHHDADTGRCGDRALTIAASSYAQLRQVDVGVWRGESFRGEPIPRLDEVLEQIPAGKRLLIEIKSGPETAPPLASLLSSEAYRHARIALISFRLDSLLACRRVLPDLPCYPVFSSRDDGPRHDLKSWIELAQRHGFRGLDPDFRDIDADFAEHVAGAGLELLCWTVNRVEDARRLAALGVAALTSDWPRRLREALNSPAPEESEHDL